MRYAIVTGAASGMGRIYVRRLLERGYGVIAADVNGAALEGLVQECSGACVIPVRLDLTSDDAVPRLEAVAREHGAQVEVLVNNAGMIFTTPVVETDPGRLAAMMKLHCVTPLLLCRAFVPQMQERGVGYVLNISSICAWMPWPVIGMYGNTKRFVKDYSRSLRIECRYSGVSVTAAIFGAVDTPLFGFTDVMRRRMLRLGVMISPEKAVDKALEAMFARRAQAFPGFVNRIAVLFVPLLPEWLLARLARRFGPALGRL